MNLQTAPLATHSIHTRVADYHRRHEGMSAFPVPVQLHPVGRSETSCSLSARLGNWIEGVRGFQSLGTMLSWNLPVYARVLALCWVLVSGFGFGEYGIHSEQNAFVLSLNLRRVPQQCCSSNSTTQ